ncbi:MAG: dipeptidase [Acidobacteriota bacterium]
MKTSTRTFVFVLLLAVGLLACGGSGPAEEPVRETEDLRTKADRLAQEMLIVDTHIDVPYRMTAGLEDISVATEKGDFDYPRAQQGGLDSPFMSIYIPASYQTDGGAKDFADELIDMVEGFTTQWPEKFALAASPDAVEAVAAEGKIALPMGMENGAPVEGSLENLRHFFERGIRYITLTHSENNHICDSSYSEERQWNGLSPFGREVVAEMNRLGMMIDISHVSDDTFYQVMELSQAPVIASHSSARRFTPEFERNMNDDMIRLLAENGGVIHINFGSAFLSAEAREKSQALWAAMRTYAEENGLSRGDTELQEYLDHYRQENPPVFADIRDVVAHIEHVVGLVGVDHVGLGSDYDGVGDSLPTGLKDVASYPNLIYELLQKGYSEEDVEKILSGNLMRVWRQVEETARSMQASAG